MGSQLVVKPERISYADCTLIRDRLRDRQPGVVRIQNVVPADGAPKAEQALEES